MSTPSPSLPPRGGKSHMKLRNILWWMRDAYKSEDEAMRDRFTPDRMRAMSQDNDHPLCHAAQNTLENDA